MSDFDCGCDASKEAAALEDKLSRILRTLDDMYQSESKHVRAVASKLRTLLS